MSDGGEARVRTRVWHALVAGSVAGVSATLVCHPFDTIRTRMTSGHAVFRGLGVRETVRRTVEEGGLRALYKGCGPPLLAQAVYKAVIFSANAAMLRLLPPVRDAADVVGRVRNAMLAGAVAGSVNALVVAPVELVRNHLMMHTTADTATSTTTATATTLQKSPGGQGSSHVLREMVQRHGVRGLWHGLSATVARDGLGMALFFGAFASAGHLLEPYVEQGRLTPMAAKLVAGGCAGIAFWTVGLPLDVVKSVIQLAEPGQVGGLWRCTTDLIQREGVGRLFRGWQVAYGRGIPGAAITLIVYDECMSSLTLAADGCG